jgi:putative hemolysin
MDAFDWTVARAPHEIAEAQRVRWRVYGEEEQLLPTSASVAGREIDARDEDKDTVHLLVRAGGEAVGTVRLLSARPGRGAARTRLGLELESSFDLGEVGTDALVPAEITRFCVLRRYRCTGVARTLHAALGTESRRRGITHWFAAANMGTDLAEDASLAYRLVCARTLLDAHFHARPRLGPPWHTPRRRACYTEGQRERASRGELGSLDVPRTLALFATRMGARYLGPPAYDRYFNVFALPLVAPLSPAFPELDGGAR